METLKCSVAIYIMLRALALQSAMKWMFGKSGSVNLKGKQFSQYYVLLIGSALGLFVPHENDKLND